MERLAEDGSDWHWRPSGLRAVVELIEAKKRLLEAEARSQGAETRRRHAEADRTEAERELIKSQTAASDLAIFLSAMFSTFAVIGFGG